MPPTRNTGWRGQPSISRTYLDIETGAEAREVVLALTKPFKAFTPPAPFNPAKVKLGNRKEAVAIEEHIAAARAKYEEDAEDARAEYEAKKAEYFANALERAALSALTGHVVAIGLRRGGATRYLTAEDPAQEKAILGQFLDLVIAHIIRGDQIVGFNTGTGLFTGFDLLFLAQRAMKYGLSITPMREGRFWNSVFVDLADVWRCGDRTSFVSLDILAKFLGFKGKNGDGACFAELFAQDREKALAYLSNDLDQTALVAGCMGYGPGPELAEIDPFAAVGTSL